MPFWQFWVRALWPVFYLEHKNRWDGRVDRPANQADGPSHSTEVPDLELLIEDVRMNYSVGDCSPYGPSQLLSRS